MRALLQKQMEKRRATSNQAGIKMAGAHFQIIVRQLAEFRQAEDEVIQPEAQVHIAGIAKASMSSARAVALPFRQRKQDIEIGGRRKLPEAISADRYGREGHCVSWRALEGLVAREMKNATQHAIGQSCACPLIVLDQTAGHQRGRGIRA